MTRQKANIRSLAARTYLDAKGVLSTAVDNFTQIAPHHNITDIRAFVKHWGEAFMHSNFNGNFEDKPRAGRPGKLSPADGRKIASELKRGGRGSYRKTGYLSFQTAAKDNKIIREIVTSNQVSLRTALRAAKLADDDLAHRQRATLKSFLTEKHKARRRKDGK